MLQEQAEHSLFYIYVKYLCPAIDPGKTREMIKVLDNYYLDPRPKVPIFPKASAVCQSKTRRYRATDSSSDTHLSPLGHVDHGEGSLE